MRADPEMEDQPVGLTIDFKFPYKFEVFQFRGVAQAAQKPSQSSK